MTNKRKLLYAGLGLLFTGALLVSSALLFIFGANLTNLSGLKSQLKEDFPELYKTIVQSVLAMGKEDISAAESLGLPRLELNLSRKDVAHIQNLYRAFEGGDVEYYAQNNVWRKAEMTYGNRPYKIKVKVHGRQPSNHREGRHVSLAIRLRDGEQIGGAKRFSLIVRVRIGRTRQASLGMSRSMGLITQESYPVLVKINGWPEKIYYLEHRLDEGHMEARGHAPLVRFEHSFSPLQSPNKSLIIGGRRGEVDQGLDVKLKGALRDEGINELHHVHYLTRYRGLNGAILNRDSENITKYFDLSYVTRLQALRLIQGYVGHGWVAGNFYVFYNSANGKFYPAVTRDNVPSPLVFDEGSTPEQCLHTWALEWEGDGAQPLEFPLFDALSRNDLVRHSTYRLIYEIISSWPEYEIQIDKIVSREKALFSFGWLDPVLQKLMGNPKSELRRNISALKSYLEKSEPSSTITLYPDVLEIDIDPQSMSALKIETLRLSVLPGAKNRSTKLRVQVIEITPAGSQVIKSVEINARPVDGFLDISGAVSDLFLSTGLASDLGKETRTYKIIAKAVGAQDEPVFDRVGEAAISFKNTVTGASISLLDLEIIRKDRSTNSELDMLVAPRSKPESQYEALKIKFPEINMKMDLVRNTLTIYAGNYPILQDFISPAGTKLVLEKGVSLALGESVALHGTGGIEILGTSEKPVVIEAIDPSKPYGTIGILGGNKASSTIDYLIQSGGSERWIDGVYFSGGFSIHYNKTVTIRNSSFSNNSADDGLNIKNANNIVISNSVFKDNFADQVDLDYVTGVVASSRFINTLGGDQNGDGLDISGSHIIVLQTDFVGFRDKGLSVGEKSTVLVQSSSFENNLNAAAIKDLSRATFIETRFAKNTTDINVYQKKRIFGGGFAFIDRASFDSRLFGWALDKKSSLSVFDGTTLENHRYSDIDNDSIEEFLQKMSALIDESVLVTYDNQ